ncbi:hypothetical protein [Parafrankia sp. BMG5.11]|uniref:hypothetical protein n=1 Tax=Parafrankia sp. BMG5.11 TaxID=222540 RepID=UPI00103CF3E7|nr:hypothetical protein [Parafrankia sp. BMG5.11]TCJ36860.1 hypothetical protein E0504_21525 [Parafrankia sp. BMG5.11]
MTGPGGVLDLPVPAGITRDALLALLVEQVPAGARLTWTQTLEDDPPDHILSWESAPPAGA